jgi:K+ transporter
MTGGWRCRPGPRRWRWLAWVLLVAPALALGFFGSGYFMAGSFSVANPEAADHWHLIARIYLTLASLSLLPLVISLVLLARRARSTRPHATSV